MRIGELAERAGVSPRSLRYYEEQGLLAAERSPSGQRRYGEDEVQRVRFIQNLYAAGLSSRTIASVLPCVESPGLDTSEDALAILREERERLAAHVAELQGTLAALDAVVACSASHRDNLVAAEAPGLRAG
jgi:DNA-binding transcriptional MerR regulator